MPPCLPLYDSLESHIVSLLTSRSMRQRLYFPSHDACEALTATVVDNAFSGHRVRLKRYASGSAIWQPSDLPDRVFRLQSGRVNIVIVNAHGGEHLYRAVAPGELFGEMCFCDHRHEPHGSVALSLGPSEVWVSSYDDFRRVIRTDASLVDSVIQTFCARVSDAAQRVQILACRDARERLARLLIHLAQVRTPRGASLPEEAALTITHSDLAAMAALSRPHVSVLMNEFRIHRLVSYGRAGPLRVRTHKLRRVVGGVED
jgi:CRP/FNR family transcriptional regulator, cyclic AMP receptor protein